VCQTPEEPGVEERTMVGEWMIAAALVALAPAADGDVPTTQPGPQPVMYTGSTELSDLLQVEVVGDQLVVVGTQDDLAMIRALVEAMEQAGPEPEIQIFYLKNAQAGTLAPDITRLWNQMEAAKTTRRPEDRVAIMADEMSNAIVVAGTSANIEKIAELIEGIDNAPSLIGTEFDMTPIPLKNIRASEAATVVRETLEKLQKRRGVRTPVGIDVQVLPSQNSLLVIAPQKDIEQVRQLIDIIDREPTETWGTVSKLAVFPLTKAEAEALAKTLGDMIEMERTGQSEAISDQIRRLRVTTFGPDGEPVDLPDLDLEKPIKIIADKGMNAVIIGTTDRNLKAVGAIVRMLDEQPKAEERLVKIFPLEHADAENMAEILRDIFDEGKNLPEVPGKQIAGAIPEGPAGKAMAYNVSVTTDPRINAVVVSGLVEQVAFAQSIIEKMDVEGFGYRFPIQFIKMEHADPDRIVDMVTKLNEQRIEMLQKRGVKATELERIFIIADPRTEQVIISATQDNVNEVRELVAKLDAMPPDFLGDINILPVENLMATDLGPKIEQLWERRMRLKEKRGETYDEMPVVVPDTRSNALIIASSKEDYLAIEALVSKLEAQPLAPTAEIHIQVLEHNEAGKLGPMLQDLFEQRAQMRLIKGQELQPSDRLTIVTDDATNTMLIASSREVYDEIVQLLAQLDAPLDVSGVVRLFSLQHADATRAAKMIEDLYQKGIRRPSGAPGSAIQESQRNVSIVTDSRSNTLIISATPENFAIIERLLTEIDSEETPAFTPEMNVFALTHGDAVKIADMLDQLFEGIRRTLPQSEADEMQMTFIPDDQNNVVVAVGSRYGMRRAEELIGKIDVPPGQPSGEVQVYQLKYATASRLADMLTELFEKRRPTGAQGERTPTNILADDGSNSLIVTASRADQATVVQLLEMLDKSSTLAQQMHIIPLQRAKAEDLADTLSKLLEQQGARAGEAQGFTIAPEPRTNSLVVFAGPDLLNNIRIIAEQLDSTRPVVELAMRVIRLKQAKAEELADRLQEFLQNAAGGDQQQNASLILSFKQFDEATQKEVLRKLVHEDITITPDPRTNSLLLLAPPDSIEMLETMINMLDEIKPITAEIQMYLLMNADAEETKNLLEELFQVGEKAPRGGQAEQERRLVLGEMGGFGVQAGTAELAFSVDKRTNTVIAAGSPEYLEIVEQVVFRLDALDIQNRVQRIFKLRNAVAQNVAATMSSYFEAEARVLESEGAEESVLRKLERQVTIEADEDSNTVILSYNPRLERQVIDMVNKLDQAPPQVMIQVLLAEVTLTDRVEMGVEFALSDLLFSENAVVGPNGVIQGDNFDFVGGTSVGAQGSGSLGGFTFTISGEDFNFLLRALQTEGRLEVLSRPSIMVADNQEANITVGENVPVVNNVTVTSGTVVPSVNYEKVGIILDVEPHINPDGYVNLHIMPEISAIGTSSVTIGSGISLPVFTERSADTWVTVRDGETIVIGGLITSNDRDSENKVPVAGDIPFLGPLFRSTVTDKTKTELLIVLTPKVIRSETEAREISVEARDQTGLLDRVRTNPLMEKLRIHSADDRLGPPTSEEAPPSGAAPGPNGGEMKKGQYGPALDAYGPKASVLGSYGPQAPTVAQEVSVAERRDEK
jgi:type II secretion system protein D